MTTPADPAPLLAKASAALPSALPGANTLVALAACVLFGLTAGVVGTFAVARRRALLADVAGHATLAGVSLAFLAGEATGLGGRTPWLLSLGAFAAALAAALAAPRLARIPRLGADGANAVLLSLGFGAGVALLSVVQSDPSGAQGGLRRLLFGSAATTTRADLAALALLSAAALATTALLFRGLSAIAFDELHARVAGLPVARLDLVLVALVVAAVVAGMQVAGVVLVVAMLITPAVAARQRGGPIPRLVVRAALLGAGSAAAGVALSLALSLPTGAAMTLSATALFAGSLVASRVLPRRTGPVRTAESAGAGAR